jgi:hypothetical protein
MKNKTTRRVVTGNNSEEDFLREVARFDTQGTMEEGGGGMHATPTIDYGIVLSGRVCQEFDQCD